MKEKIALDDVRIESLSEDLKKGFPKSISCILLKSIIFL